MANKRCGLWGMLLALALAGNTMLAACGQSTTPQEQAETSAQEAEDSSSATQEDSSTTTGATDEAPQLSDLDATVYTVDKEAVTLSQIADGKPLVINFWATWCPFCVDEMPDFQQIHAEYNKKINFAFIDVADGERETVADAKDWLEEQGLSDLPVYFDSTLEASTAFGAYGLPTTAVIGADGEILTVSAGRIDPAQMRLILEELV